MTTNGDHDVWRFRLTLVGLIALLVIVPVGAAALFNLDSRTPVTIAEDTLLAKYDLKTVDAEGKAIPPDTSAVTISEFSLVPGATTEDVPFRLHGLLVHCTVHAPDDDPRSVTADCAR